MRLRTSIRKRRLWFRTPMGKSHLTHCSSTARRISGSTATACRPAELARGVVGSAAHTSRCSTVPTPKRCSMHAVVQEQYRRGSALSAALHTSLAHLGVKRSAQLGAQLPVRSQVHGEWSASMDRFGVLAPLRRFAGIIGSDVGSSGTGGPLSVCSSCSASRTLPRSTEQLGSARRCGLSSIAVQVHPWKGMQGRGRSASPCLPAS